VIEDNLINTKLLKAILEKSDCEVITTENGKEVAAALKDGHPDVILMDIMMPVMDGWEATKIIKEYTSTKDIPIIIVTADHSPRNEQKAEEFQCACIISKPIKIFKLLSTIRSSIH